MNKYLLILLFSFIGVKVVAQSSCERNLNEARSDYSNGNLYAIPGKLTDCLEEGFSKTEKIEALRLLTLTYININQQEKARSTFIKLLNIKTDYQVQQNVDPSELYSLYRKIDTDIKYFIGVTFGLNYNSIIVHGYRNTNPIQSNESIHIPDYKARVSNPQVGVQFLYPITKSLIAGAEIQFQNQRFEYEETNYNITDNYDSENSSDEVISEDNRSIISYESRNNGLNLNVNLRYMKDYYVWKPFIEVGAIGRYNLSYYVFNYDNNYQLSVEEELISEFDISPRRTDYNVGIFTNIGTMIKLGENYAEIKFGVSNYFINHLTADARRTAHTASIANAMALLDDDYTNLVYQLNVSFNIPFFNFK